MKVLGIIFAVIFAAAVIFVLFLAARSGRFFKSVLINAAVGLIALILVNITSRFTGAEIPLNSFTVLGASLLGLPSVIFSLVMPFIFI